VAELLRPPPLLAAATGGLRSLPPVSRLLADEAAAVVVALPAPPPPLLPLPEWRLLRARLPIGEGWRRVAELGRGSAEADGALGAQAPVTSGPSMAAVRAACASSRVGGGGGGWPL
jgi:hypothetical protein